jgi:hypothetical protein
MPNSHLIEAMFIGFFLFHIKGSILSVNRLKLIKRQMYGRANFDLLRRRVIGGPALWNPG